MTDLTPVQQSVIAAITGGATMKAAAVAASIHRNTIAYWSRTSPAFREALSNAQYDKALFIREEAENHVADAFAAIHAILNNPAASDSARLNAAKYIIDKATAPQLEIVHSNAQIGFESQNEIVPEDAPSPAPVHPNPTQIVRSGPKVGRNDPCPCGSHLKFKRCCLGKSTLAAAA